MTLVGLVPGVFAVFAAPLVAPGSGTRRTRAGRDLWSRIGGFHRVLSTTSSKERFDFSGREELYTAYIPWAVALRLRRRLGRKYRTEMGAEPPVPSYFAGAYVGAGVGDTSARWSTTSPRPWARPSRRTRPRRAPRRAEAAASRGGGGGGGGGSWGSW